MTDTAPEDRFIVYSYVGAASRAIDEYTAEGILQLRPELRHAGGLLAAPLGLMSTSGTGVTVHIHAAGAPTRIDVHMYESGDGVERVKVDTKVLRVGRSQVFAEGRFSDADNPSRQLGYSTVSYVATGPGTGVLENHDEPPYAGPARNERPITEIYGGVPRADGGFDIPDLPTRLRAGGRIHSGTMEILGEAAGMAATKLKTGVERMRTEHMSTTILSAGRGGPFSITPEVLASGDDFSICRMELIDHGNEDRLLAVVRTRYRLLP
jgi:acyl-coenzyme A thioesterase PaaI-like protein